MATFRKYFVVSLIVLFSFAVTPQLYTELKEKKSVAFVLSIATDFDVSHTFWFALISLMQNDAKQRLVDISGCLLDDSARKLQLYVRNYTCTPFNFRTREWGKSDSISNVTVAAVLSLFNTFGKRRKDERSKFSRSLVLLWCFHRIPVINFSILFLYLYFSISILLFVLKRYIKNNVKMFDIKRYIDLYQPYLHIKIEILNLVFALLNKNCDKIIHRNF